MPSVSNRTRGRLSPCRRGHLEVESEGENHPCRFVGCCPCCRSRWLSWSGLMVRPITGSTTSGRFHPPASSLLTPIAKSFRTASTNWESRSTLSATRSRRSQLYWRSCRMCRSMTRPSAGCSRITSSSTSGKSPSPRNCSHEGLARAGQLRAWAGALEHGDRVGRSRLRLEDRRLGAALWTCRAGLVSSRTRRIGSGSMSGAMAVERH